MKIAVFGGTGLIGKKLIRRLLENHNSVLLFSRRPELPNALKGFDHLELLGMSSEELSRLQETDAVINLAGESIVGRRWSQKAKDSIRSSRVDLTRKIVQKIKTLDSKPKVLLNASAIGFYGMFPDDHEAFVEGMDPESDYLSQVCQDWERQALVAEEMGMRVVLLRTGIVLSKEGGALASLLPLFQLNGGGIVGTGQQWMSWIHEEDEIQAILFLLENAKLRGPFNLTSPYPATNERFTKTLAKVLHRLAILPVPSIALKLLFGEGSRIVTEGQKVLPKKLLDSGYEFVHPDLEEAFHSLLDYGKNPGM